MAVRGILVTVAVVIIVAAISVPIVMIKNKNKPQKPSPDQYPAGVLWYNATVSKSRQGAYRTITEALAAAPAFSVDKFYIHIEAGLYEERKSPRFLGVGDTRSSPPSTPRPLVRTLTPHSTFNVCDHVLMF
ncbi:hypothetical protein ACJIZ3_009380 [Penstemon smallii]|uniref:Pectinesterase n=1 Tax=Penstemon smallii TaxID=265156 RepID=A0ABD3TCE3_9LAMI